MRHPIPQLLSHVAEMLAPLSLPADMPRWEAEWLVSHSLKQDRSWLRSHPEYALTPAETRRLQRLIKRRLQHEPLAYILGEWPFCNLSFLVDKRVLIPRPETEELVTRAKVLLAQQTIPPLVWDVGTGSGAIGICLAHSFPHLSVFASDREKGALTLARKNAKRLLPAHANIRFFQANLLDASLKTRITRTRGPLFVIANLPYLPFSDRKTLTRDVVDHEPHRALFAAKEGLSLISQLLRQLKRLLITSPRACTILLEYDPPQQKTLARTIGSLFPEARVTFQRDLSGRERWVEIVYDSKPAKI